MHSVTVSQILEYSFLVNAKLISYSLLSLGSCTKKSSHVKFFSPILYGGGPKSQPPPKRKSFLNPHKIEVLITLLIKLLELLHFGYMTMSRIELESHDKVLSLTIRKEIVILWPFFQNEISSRRGISNFADIIKIITKLIETTSNKSVKVKRIANYVLKCNFYLYFPT